MASSRKPRSPEPAGQAATGDGSSVPAESRPLRFYDSDESLARIVAEFLREGFEHGSPGVVIVTPRQRDELVRELTARSYDVVALQASRDLVLVDGEKCLAAFMVDGKPDARKFRDEICHLIQSVRCRRADCTVRVFGQMVDVLWQQGKRDAAIRLELLWNQLARSEGPSAVCGYAIGNFYKNARFEDVCAETKFVTHRESHGPTSAASDASRRSSPRSRRP